MQKYRVTYLNGKECTVECTTLHITPGQGHLKFLEGQGSAAQVILFVNQSQVMTVERI